MGNNFSQVLGERHRVIIEKIDPLPLRLRRRPVSLRGRVSPARDKDLELVRGIIEITDTGQAARLHTVRRWYDNADRGQRVAHRLEITLT